MVVFGCHFKYLLNIKKKEFQDS